MEINKIICGDCIEEMKKLPDNFVDAIITDPPYNTGMMKKEINPKYIEIANKGLAQTTIESFLSQSKL
mgnify:CR=1 FL=1